MPKLSDLRPIPGTRRYVDVTTGETFSRRTYDTLRTGSSPETRAYLGNLQREMGVLPGRRDAGYQQIVRQWQEGRRAQGLDPRVRGNSEGAQDFKQMMRELKYIDESMKGKDRRSRNAAKWQLFQDWGVYDDGDDNPYLL